MLDEALLRDRFEDLLEQQRQVEGLYSSLAERVDDPAVRDHIDQLCREKRRHIELTERLLEIVG